jgi:hypothetical protein
MEQREFSPLEMVSYDTTDRGRIGIWMTDDNKECMSGDLAKSLQDDRLHFAKEFVTNRVVPKGKDSSREIKMEFCKQLEHYREELIVPKDAATGVSKKKFTGKTSGGKKDDMVICCMIALYCSGKKRREVAFMKLAHARGWRY